MNLTNEQIQAILDGAPEGATHVDIEGDYWVMQETQAQFWADKFEWSYAEPQEPLHDLSDLREILTLRQQREQDEVIIRALSIEVERLKAQQSEVAARAVEDAVKKYKLPSFAGPDIFSDGLLDYANQLREQGDV